MAFTGERFVPEATGNIAIEHLHRYYSALPLVAGKTVLDIASGEGYGSALLASLAAHVYGVDIAADAVAHAKSKYVGDTLEFRVGSCTAIPLPDHSVDVIVSFETLEHHDQHEESMREFKRVLRPGGALLISSPDKKNYSDLRGFHNAFHVKELYEEEFRDLLQRHFRQTQFFSQRIAFGSVLLPVSTPSTASSHLYRGGEIISSAGMVEPLYHLALASDGEPGVLDMGIFEQPINDTEVIQSWERVMADRDRQLDNLRDERERLATDNRELAAQIAELLQLRQQLADELTRLKDAHEHEKRRAEDLAAENEIILTSKFWMLMAPLRKARRLLEPLLVSRGFGVLADRNRQGLRVRNALAYLRRGDVKGLLDRVRHYQREARIEVIKQGLRTAGGRTWGILTTPHTLFIAQCMAERLMTHGINTTIMTQPPKNFDEDLYIVLCAQMFERLPPGEKRVIFQLEQSVSSRWFKPDYLATLKNSLAVLEYSLVNTDFLADKGIAYPHVFYLPIGTTLQPKPPVPAEEKEFDFLFYGDYFSSPRRAKMIEALQARFDVKLCNNAFGEEMHALIRKARVVVNIHYYENALLEMPRIQECLSQGVPVLSEAAQDQADYPELEGAVHFFEEGSVEDMLRVAERMLQLEETLDRQVLRATDASARRFTFMFDRFLTALGVLPPNAILNAPVYLPDEQPQIALSLPETIKRRRLFLETQPPASTVFDGIRNVKGWIGCGSSYSALARHARQAGRMELTVFEDDAVFRDDHLQRLGAIRTYLESTDGWDIFSGMIASVHADTRVLDVTEQDGLTFVKLDRMTSMVFNIYNRKAIDLLADWDPTNGEVHTNAIDRYLENQEDLRVVVTLPFLVGHREEMMSTLWGFQNDHYSQMIAEAEARIEALAKAWRREHRHC